MGDRGFILGLVMGSRKKNSYALRDEFTDTRAAGSVNGTLATPTGGARTVTDLDSKLSISGGKALIGNGAGANDCALAWPSVVRAAGKALFAKMAIAGTGNSTIFGFGTNATGVPTNLAIHMASTLVSYEGATATTVGAVATATDYYICALQRAVGGFTFIKGGAFSKWTLLYVGKRANTSPVYPRLHGRTTANGSAEFVRIPVSRLTAPIPAASDSFTRADGVLGNTIGGGSEESGGSGIAWSDTTGTWAIATNKAACTALSGSIGIATLQSGKINVLVECAVTRTAGNAGIVLRYADANNYVYALHNGTNAQLIKVVAGSPTTLVNAAATYSADARLIVSANATKFRLYYNDVLIGTEQTISDAALQTSGAHGIYTSNTGNTLDNFVVWALGSNDEYAAFDRFIG